MCCCGNSLLSRQKVRGKEAEKDGWRELEGEREGWRNGERDGWKEGGSYGLREGGRKCCHGDRVMSQGEGMCLTQTQ